MFVLPSASDLDQLGEAGLDQVAASRRTRSRAGRRQLDTEQFGVGWLGVEQDADLRLAHRTRPVVVSAAELVGPPGSNNVNLLLSGGNQPGETAPRVVGRIGIVHQDEVGTFRGEDLVDQRRQVGRDR